MLSTGYRAARNSCNAVGLGVTTLEMLLPVKLSIWSIYDSAIQLRYKFKRNAYICGLKNSYKNVLSTLFLTLN